MARREKDPFINCRFALELDNVQVAGFAECTGLQMETKVFEYKEGGANQTTRKFPEHSSHGNITLKRGVTKSNDLLKWQIDVATGQFKTNPRSGQQKIAIVLLDEKSNDGVKRWNLARAFPVKWVGPELKAGDNAAAIETLEIAHEGIDVS
jgi:phage tail-like protein